MGHRTAIDRRRLGALCLAVALAALPGAAAAAGFQLQEQNASGLGNAFAGQAAAAEDASTIYFNPAGLTRVPGRQAVGALHLIRPSTRFRDAGSCAPYLGTAAGSSACPFGAGGNLGHAPGGDGGDAGDLSAVPNAYLSWEFVPDRVWLGLGLTVPYGLTTEWDAGWAGRFHALNSEVQTIDLNPTLAWRLDERISVGIGLSARLLRADLSNAVSYRAVALASGVPALAAAVPAGAEGVAAIDGDDWGWGWNAGALVELNDATRLGIAYRSATKHRLKGDVRFSDRPAALAAVPQVADGGVSAEVELPGMLSVALAHRLTPQLELLADWTRTGWDSIQDLTIVRDDGALAGQTLTSTPLRFRDSWRAGLGANYRLDDRWTLRAGLAIDRTPVTDAFRTPRLPDADRRWLAFGVQWRFAPNAALDVGYAYLRVRDATSDLPNQETAASAPRGSLVGRYEPKTQLVGAQLRWSF